MIVDKTGYLDKIENLPNDTRKFENMDNCPLFWAILSGINNPTFKFAKFFVPKLKSLTSNKYTVKDSFAFDEEIVEQDSEFLWETLMLVLFLLTSHLKRQWKYALIHFFRIRKK